MLIDVPLGDALIALLDRSELEILFESGLVDGRVTRCRVQTSDPIVALRCVLGETGVDYLTLSSGVIVLVEKSLKAPVLGRVIGRVVDKATGIPVSRAHVRDLTERRTAVSDDDGRFVLGSVRSGPHVLEVTHLAYEARRDTVRVTEGLVRHTMSLSPAVLDTPAIIISGLHAIPWDAPDQELTGIIGSPDAQTVGALGSLDAVAGVHTDPGGGGTHVQGGAPGDHFVTLDGAPVFTPLRNGGLFGPFSPLAVSSITVHRAGYRARDGGSLAGGIDVGHGLGWPEDPFGVALVSPLAANLRLGGQRNRLRWMVAGRSELGREGRPNSLDRRLRQWSSPDPYLSGALFGADEGELDRLSETLEARETIISYFDLHTAAEVSLGPGRRLYGSAYLADNRFGTPALEAPPLDRNAVSDEYVWKNRMAQVRYSFLAGTGALLSAGAWTSAFVLRHPFSESPQGGSSVDSEFNEVVSSGLFGTLESGLNANLAYTLEAGIRNLDADARIGIDPGNPARELLSGTIPQVRWLWEFTLDSDWTPRPGFRVTAGSRLTYIHGRRTVYAEPRLGVERTGVLGGREARVRVSGGLYRQYVNQFDVASWSFSAILPTFRTWVPLHQNQGPATALHLAGETSVAVNPTLTISADAYAKRMLRIYELGVLAAEPAQVEGTGSATGASLAGTWTSGNAEVVLSQEIARSTREIPGRYAGKAIATPWVQPHRTTVQVRLQSVGDWVTTLRVSRISGRSWAFRRAYYHYLTGEEPNVLFNVQRPDSDRLPIHLQIDASLARTWRVGASRLVTRVDVLNVFDTANVTEYRQDDSGERIGIPGLPRLAVFSVRATF